MHMRMMIAGTCLALALVIVATAGAEGDPKYTISDVMKKGHGGKASLLKKVTSGTATEAEGKELLAMYEALAKNKPPQGDADSWKAKTTALVAGAKLYVEGKKDEAKTKLTEASNCKGCHSVHK